MLKLHGIVQVQSLLAGIVAAGGPFFSWAMRASGRFDAALAVDEITAAILGLHQAQCNVACCSRGDGQGGGPHVDLGCAPDEYVTLDSARRDIEEATKKWSL